MTAVHACRKNKNRNETLLTRVKNLVAACHLKHQHSYEEVCAYCDYKDRCATLMQKLGLTNYVCMSLVYASKLLSAGYRVVELGLRTSEEFAERAEVLHWDKDKETYEQHIDRICISVKATPPSVGLELLFAKIIDLHCNIAYKTSIGEFKDVEEYSFAYSKLIELLVQQFEIPFSTNMDTVLENTVEHVNGIEDTLIL